MKSAFWALPLAVLVVTLLTPLVRMLAFRLGAVARPGGRHVHQRAIPRLGGVGIAVAFFTPLAVLGTTVAPIREALGQDGMRLTGLVVGGLLMCALGVVDDTKGIRAIYKLFAQIAVALFAYKCGFNIVAIHVPFVGDVSLGVLDLPLTVLWIIGVVNAINLIDGLDGLAAGVVLFAAGTNLYLSYQGGSVFVALLSASTAGAAFGFLFYNFNPARIFMGDSGSYFLGYVLAVTAIVSQKASTAVSLLVPMIALGVPIFDTLFAMVRRILERRSVFSPDRGHIHHRLLDMGITHRRAVLIIYGLCVACTIAAVGITFNRSWEVGAAMACALAVLVGLVRFVGSFEAFLIQSRQKARLRARDSEFLRYALPRLPMRGTEACSEGELFEALAAFAAEADLRFVDVIARNLEDSDPRIDPARLPKGDAPAFRWSKDGLDPAKMRDLVTARFPIGRDASARATLKFGWDSEYGDVNPQSEIILQVATDILEQNLVRLRSPLAPIAAEEPAAVSSRAGARPSQPALARRTG
jgi:UDP-GlcNAc:undecaprenyl-phosphate GlcNAc-1-phosphate transferase